MNRASLIGRHGAALFLAIAASAALAQDATQQLGTSGLLMVRAQEKTFFMTNDGRFVLQGQLYDMWDDGKVLPTVEALAEAVNKIPLQSMGFSSNELGAWREGTGQREVVVFFAPGCGYCKDLLRECDGLQGEYRFTFVPLSGGTRETAELSGRLLCGATQGMPGKQLREAFLTGRLDQLPSAEACDSGSVLQRNAAVARLLGVDAVPFLVAPDGRVSRGRPQGLSAFLRGGKS